MNATSYLEDTIDQALGITDFYRATACNATHGIAYLVQYVK